MALAIPAAPQVVGPMTTLTKGRRRRRANRRKFLSRKVRERNNELGRPWWQPSRAFFRGAATPRAAALEAALREELDDSVEKLKPVVVGYQDWAVIHEFERKLEEEEVIFQTAITSGLEDSFRASRLCGCQEFFAEEIQEFHEDPEIAGCACLLGELDREALQSLAAA